MKNAFYFVIIGLFFAVFACKKGDQSYSFSRPTDTLNFKTTLDGEFYTSTKDDVASARGDYYLRVTGTIVTYGDTILEYGHCWGTSPNPTDIVKVNEDNVWELSTHFINTTLGRFDSISFESQLGKAGQLLPETDYYVRTWVIRGILDAQGNVVGTELAYNPYVSVIPTKPAIDEWFEQCLECFYGGDKPTTTARFDAIAFNLGDTVFFGTGSQGRAAVTKELYMYDPKAVGGGAWNTEGAIALTKWPDLPYAGMMDGIGFAIRYQRRNVPNGQLTTSIFVGFGDHGGRNVQTEKSASLYEYDLGKDPGFWVERKSNLNRRSGAVCFVIDGLAYIGTGEGSAKTANWSVFDPAAAADPTDLTGGWRQLSSSTNYPNIPRKGAISFVINGKGYFGLGVDADGKFLRDFYVFTPSPNPAEPELGRFENLESLPDTVEPRANAVAFVVGDQGYVGTGDNLTDLGGGSNPYFMEEENQYAGEIFNDFYRFNPYTNKWYAVRNYTATKAENNRPDAIRPVTRATGFAIPGKKLGYVGYGLVPPLYPIPNPPEDQATTTYAQKDFWRYQPFDDSAK